MKKYIIILTFLISTLDSFCQSIYETKLFIQNEIEHKLYDDWTYERISKKLLLSSTHYGKISFLKNYLIYSKEYSTDYILKYNLKDEESKEFYIVDISKIYSLKRENWDENNCALDFLTKDNGAYKLNSIEFNNFKKNQRIISKNKSIDWCIIEIHNFSEDDFKKVNSAFKHLVKLYGGKIIDDLF